MGAVTTTRTRRAGPGHFPGRRRVRCRYGRRRGIRRGWERVGIHVNVDNFVRAETDRMFRDIQRDAGGPNRFRHNREPARIDEQTVIRLNRDTLYSFAIVDLQGGATLTLPEAGSRYMSAMVVNNDHFVAEILHDAGPHELDEAVIGTRYVCVAVRTLVDPDDPADIAAVAALQDQLVLEAGGQAFTSPAYDVGSLDATRTALLTLAAGLTSFDRTFGTPDQVDPVRHLIGTAAGWGGLPTTEAAYVGAAPTSGPGDYELTLADVPVDAFWSISVYNRDGFFEPNPWDLYTVNSVTATPGADGSVTVRFVTGEPTEPNSIPVPTGWNYLVRLYRPREAFFDGSWTLPAATRVD